MLSNTDVISAVIDINTHRASCNSKGNSKTLHIIDQTVLHIIAQSDFHSWHLQNFKVSHDS